MKGFSPLAKLKGSDMHYNNLDWTTPRPDLCCDYPRDSFTESVFT
jgi:hypothetical protein